MKRGKITKTEIHISNLTLPRTVNSQILKDFVNSDIFSYCVVHCFDDCARLS